MAPSLAHDPISALRPAPAATTTPAKPCLSVVIVNYRQWRNTARLVKELSTAAAVGAGRVEIVVIDNGAVRSSIRRQLRKTPGVSIRAYLQNRGFGRAINEGCRLSRGDWLLLLNPDTTVHDGFLDGALAALERWRLQPQAGIVGLRLCDADRAVQGSAGPEPTLRRLLLGLLRSRSQRRCQPLHIDGPVEVPWVTGCGMMVNRACFDAIGGFDAGYFLYYEDADLCRRARHAGWTVWHDPALALQHDHPLHSRAVSARLRLLTRQALLTYADRFWKRWEFLAICRLVALEARVRGVWAHWHRRPETAAVCVLQRQVANDCRVGKFEQAYRRVWKSAQLQGRRHVRPRQPR